MGKIVAGLIVLLLVIAGAVWLIRTPAPSQEGMTSSEKTSFAWNITELAENPAAPGVPRTGITLTWGAKTFPIGEFDGSCAEIDGTSWTLVDGEKTGVICWWAGGGSEVGVFEEGGAMLVKVGSLDEGTAEIPGFRGNFQTIATIQ